MTKLRTIAAVALAAAVFGGTIGALATDAVQSQASPAAVAAAVQRVSDSNAEQSLRGINAKLATANTVLHNLGTALGILQSDLDTRFGHGIGRNLQQICQNTAPSPLIACSPGG
jgi:hypothetical protein